MINLESESHVQNLPSSISWNNETKQRVHWGGSFMPQLISRWNFTGHHWTISDRSQWHTCHAHSCAHTGMCIYIYIYIAICKYICHRFIYNDINTYGQSLLNKELETTYFLSLSPKSLIYSTCTRVCDTQAVILWPRGVRMPVQRNRAVGLPRHRERSHQRYVLYRDIPQMHLSL